MIKRFIQSAILATMGMLLFCGVASATWQFIFPIRVADTSGVTRDYYPVMLGFGGQSLVNAGKISASGNNTNMQIGGANVSYMMSTTNVTVVIPTLPAGGLASTQLYTGFSPKQTSFPIIVGEGGSVSVSDNASLEPRGNFTLTVEGFFVTDSGSEQNIIEKPDRALRLFAVAENITCEIGTDTPGNETLRPDGNVSCTMPNEAGIACPNHWDNIEEGAPNDATFNGRFGLGAGRWTDTYTLGNTAIAPGSTINSVTVTVRGEEDVNARFTAGLRLGGVTVWGTDREPGLAWTTYSEVVARPGGGSWLQTDLNDLQYTCNVTTDGGADFSYISWGYVVVSYNTFVVDALVTTGVATGKHEVIVSANGTTLHLYIDGSLEDTDPLGAPVTDNANDWVFMEDIAIPYADNITLSVNETLQLYFAPTVMLDGATIPDRGLGVDNPGTINWGSNTDVNISYGEMSSYEDYIASVAALGGFEMPEAALPSTWFASGENVENLPFYDAFRKVAAQTGRPVQMIYAVGIIGLAFGAFLMVVSFTRSALLAWFAMVFVFIIGSSMTIIPWWIPFVLILTGLAIMFLYRQVAR